MKSKRILITGADGFIGSHICADLQSSNYSLYCTEFQDVSNERHGCCPEPDDGTAVFQIDLTKPDTLKAIPDMRFDVCIHTAGSVDQSLPAKRLMEINGRGTANLLARLAETGCDHFIQLSSITVYGKNVVGTGRDESTKRRLRGLATIPYGRAKAAAEKYIEASGIPYTMLRLPPVLGEGDTAVTPVICSGIRNSGLMVCSDEEKPVTLLSIGELPRYIDQLISLGPQNAAFNCGSHHMPWKDLLAIYTREYSRIDADCESTNGHIEKKWKYSFLFHLKNKAFLMHALFSAFGSHFPTDTLESLISLRPESELSGVVESAVRHYYTHRILRIDA